MKHPITCADPESSCFNYRGFEITLEGSKFRAAGLTDAYDDLEELLGILDSNALLAADAQSMDVFVFREGKFTPAVVLDVSEQKLSFGMHTPVHHVMVQIDEFGTQGKGTLFGTTEKQVVCADHHNRTMISQIHQVENRIQALCRVKKSMQESLNRPNMDRLFAAINSNKTPTETKVSPPGSEESPD